MTSLALPMLLLYEGSVIAVRIVEKRREAARARPRHDRAAAGMKAARRSGGGFRCDRLGPDLHRHQDRRRRDDAADAVGVALRLRGAAGGVLRAAAQGAPVDSSRSTACSSASASSACCSSRSARVSRSGWLRWSSRLQAFFTIFLAWALMRETAAARAARRRGRRLSRHRADRIAAARRGEPRALADGDRAPRRAGARAISRPNSPAASTCWPS